MTEYPLRSLIRQIAFRPLRVCSFALELHLRPARNLLPRSVVVVVLTRSASFLVGKVLIYGALGSLCKFFEVAC